MGDQIVAPKTVLPWLFTAAGVPGIYTSFLVPVRESGSMLPQAVITPWIISQKSRKRAWLIGSWGQAVAAALIALCALVLSGHALGITVVFLLAAQAVFRAVCSVAGKDVQGRTISKGRRGEITGRATELAGGLTLAVGLILTFLPSELPHWALAALLGLGASTWAFASLVFAGIREPAAQTSKRVQGSSLRSTVELVKGDRDLQRFLLVRSLLLVTALSTPYIVVLGSREGANLTGLGAFVIASGGASLLGGRVSGLASDRSSKSTMAWAAGCASGVILLIVLSARIAPTSVNAWVMPIGFFLVNLAHTAVRVSRKTYLVDMAEGDRRTVITGASNTVMGVVLLVVGAISSVVSLLGPDAALVFLAVIGFAGVAAATKLRDVSAPRG